MVDTKQFKTWMKEHTKYSDPVICDHSSRMKRADSILEWTGEETYPFYLEREPSFIDLTVSVKSQIRKAVKLYTAYAASYKTD